MNVLFDLLCEVQAQVLPCLLELQCASKFSGCPVYKAMEFMLSVSGKHYLAFMSIACVPASWFIVVVAQQPSPRCY